MSIRFKSAESTERFVGTEDDPRQVLHVVLEREASDGLVTVSVSDALVSGEAVVEAGSGETVVEVPCVTRAPAGTELDATVRAHGTGGGGAVEAATRLTVAEPGWTMVMVSHFHYDPVWWNTQADYAQTWELQGNDGSTRRVWENNAFHLVRAPLYLALADEDYTFVLAEVDCLKPFGDVHPQY